MKAVDFVKKFSWFGSKEYLAGTPFFDGDVIILTDRSELKKLIEAKELVDSFGGLFHAKVALSKEGFSGGIELGGDLIDDDVLKQTIKLVEGVENE